LLLSWSRWVICTSSLPVEQPCFHRWTSCPWDRI
jgi:hypothetical protein